MSEKKDVGEVVLQTQLDIVSQLYHKLCNCRKNYEELDQLLETKFHLDDCPYRRILDQSGVEIFNGTDE